MTNGTAMEPPGQACTGVAARRPAGCARQLPRFRHTRLSSVRPRLATALRAMQRPTSPAVAAPPEPRLLRPDTASSAMCPAPGVLRITAGRFPGTRRCQRQQRHRNHQAGTGACRGAGLLEWGNGSSLTERASSASDRASTTINFAAPDLSFRQQVTRAGVVSSSAGRSAPASESRPVHAGARSRETAPGRQSFRAGR